MENLYCLIMAGGGGTRFWPRSRKEKPKQYLSILEDESLISSTISRFKNFMPENQIYVVSAKSQEKILLEHASGLPKENLIYEPVGKNTLPAIGLAALFISKKDPEGIMIVSPADHLIQNNKLFQDTVEAATIVANAKKGIVTIGVTPASPATGYGYIEVGQEINVGQKIQSNSVKRFVEKPDYETAVKYLASGNFCWNIGVFVFNVSVFIESVKKYAPELYSELMKIADTIGLDSYDETLDRIYRNLDSISIDYGIIEKSDNIYFVRGDFEWNDLGSWDEVYKCEAKDENNNVNSGEVVFHDSKNSYVYAPDSMVAVIGLDDVIVVKEGDMILVCKRNRSEEIKHVVNEISIRKLDQYL